MRARTQQVLPIVQQVLPIAGLLGLVLVFSLTTDGRFLTWNNAMSLIMQSAITLVAAIGTVFVMAHNNLDFSLGGAVALSSVLAYLVTGGSLVPFFILCVLFGILCGIFTSVVHIGGRVPAFMAGICLLFAGRGVAQSVSAETTMLMVDAAKLNNIWVFVGVIAAVFVVGFVLFNYTTLGKYQKLIGTNPKAATLSGINVAKLKTLAFVVSGITVGIAACLTVARSASVNGNTGLNLEMDVLLALSLGGISMTGGSATRMRAAFIGVAIYYILSNGLLLWGLNANYVDIVKAVVFLTTVAISIDRSQYDLIA